MAYLADENGNMTTERTGRIGGTSIPSDLLPTFIESFVEHDGATVKIGNTEMKGKFNEQEFKKMLPN